MSSLAHRCSVGGTDAFPRSQERHERRTAASRTGAPARCRNFTRGPKGRRRSAYAPPASSTTGCSRRRVRRRTLCAVACALARVLSRPGLPRQPVDQEETRASSARVPGPRSTQRPPLGSWASPSRCEGTDDTSRCPTSSRSTSRSESKRSATRLTPNHSRSSLSSSGWQRSAWRTSAPRCRTTAHRCTCDTPQPMNAPSSPSIVKAV